MQSFSFPLPPVRLVLPASKLAINRPDDRWESVAVGAGLTALVFRVSMITDDSRGSGHLAQAVAADYARATPVAWALDKSAEVRFESDRGDCRS
jgi:hypothetical protein